MTSPPSEIGRWWWDWSCLIHTLPDILHIVTQKFAYQNNNHFWWVKSPSNSWGNLDFKISEFKKVHAPFWHVKPPFLPVKPWYFHNKPTFFRVKHHETSIFSSETWHFSSHPIFNTVGKRHARATRTGAGRRSRDPRPTGRGPSGEGSGRMRWTWDKTKMKWYRYLII